tara:strand:+ start:8977 stop:9189 length:213 start_codon:yes stop_codon:yes gene_type:complete
MLIVLILIGIYYLINILVFAGIHTKKTSNRLSNTYVNNNTIVSNIQNNDIKEQLLSVVNDNQYDVGYQLN